MSDYKYESTQANELRGKVTNLILCDTEFKVRQSHGVVQFTNKHNFEQWVQVIYGGVSPYADKFNKVIADLAELPPVLACIIYRRIITDQKWAENGRIFDMDTMAWIETEKVK